MGAEVADVAVEVDDDVTAWRPRAPATSRRPCRATGPSSGSRSASSNDLGAGLARRSSRCRRRSRRRSTRIWSTRPASRSSAIGRTVAAIVAAVSRVGMQTRRRRRASARAAPRARTGSDRRWLASSGAGYGYRCDQLGDSEGRGVALDVSRPLVVGSSTRPRTPSPTAASARPPPGSRTRLHVTRRAPTIVEVGGESNVSNRPPVPRPRRSSGSSPVVEAAGRGRGRRSPIDTHRPQTAAAALEAGAAIVNDISGMRDPRDDRGSAPRRGAGVVLMHTETPPKTPLWDDGALPGRGRRPPGRVLRGAAGGARQAAGIGRERVVLDPGPTSPRRRAQTVGAAARPRPPRRLRLPDDAGGLPQGLHRRADRAQAARARRRDLRGARRRAAPRRPAAAGPRRRGHGRLPARSGRRSKADAEVPVELRIDEAVRREGRRPRRTLRDAARRRAPCSRSPWAMAIDPARRDGRIVAESAESRAAGAAGLAAHVARPRLGRGAARGGIETLYTPPAGRPVRGGRAPTWSITSGTASGKSLAFNLPVLDGDRPRPERRARSTSTRPRRWPRTRPASSASCARPGLRAGDLRRRHPEGGARRRSAARSNLVLTNPDMLHVGVLPNHKSWGDFFANLEWVVIDEAHTYRGVFGSHVANVLRRLRRVARAYGSEPRFLLASATIANPVELAERLVGTPFELIDDDGAPRAGREIAMWNPPLIDEAIGARRSALSEAADLLAELVTPGGADDLLPQKPARDRADPALRARKPRARAASRSWRQRIAPYRGGYTPQQRREIEERLSGASCWRSSRPMPWSWGSTSASSTPRSASPSPAPSPACARCGDGPGGASAGWRSTSPARTRSTSSSAAIRRSSSSARSRRRSSTTATSRSPRGT